MSQDGLKQKIERGEIVVGVSAPVNIAKDDFKALLDKGPYDYVFTDGQHSPYDEERLVEFCDLADELGVPVRFRIKHTRHAYLIGTHLDLGPSGIEVPQVELVETADEAIESFYYPPMGGRSFGGRSRVRGSEFSDPGEYAQWWNNYGVLWLQLESVAAVTGAYGLAKSGVDCLAFGPTDLSFSLQHQPHPHLKTVDDCIRHVVRTIEGTGTRVSFRSGSPDLRSKYVDMGVTVFLETPPSY